MNILGFNPSHHGSVCLLQDGEIKYFIQEERVTRKKYDNFLFKSFIDLLQTHKIDWVVWATPSIDYKYSSNHPKPYWPILAFKYHPKVKYYDLSNKHHESHIAHSFYNSGFEKCIGVVIDGIGSTIEDLGQETETIFKCSYPCNFKIIYKNVVNLELNPSKSPYKNVNVTSNMNLSRVYETVTMHLGWSRDEAGKTMGLSPYGKFNPTFPSFFISKNGNPNVFFTDPFKPSQHLKGFQETFIDTEKIPQLKLLKDPREWHYDKSKITDLEKNLAWHVQNDTQQIVGDYIEKAIKETGLKQVCCAGGYFLNCVTNYYLLKRFPDVEFYFEPIANDAGTAIGAAKTIWHDLTQDTTIRPFKSLHLGKKYSKEELIEGIKKYT